METFLSLRQRRELREQHRFENERRYADRIKALLLWDGGWSFEQISEALLLNERTIRRYRQLYEEHGLDRLLNDDWRGSERKLSESQEQRSVLVQEHVEHSKIVLVFLPAYAPNLNLIERVWKFFKKKVLANRYYESFMDFQKACGSFFKNIRKFKNELKTLLTEKFQIIVPTF